MSVRRLAEDHLQPEGFAFSAENAAWAKETIGKYPEGRQQSAVIPLLMRAQEQEGWVTKAALEAVADMLGMSYIRLLEVATFYTQFQLKPVGSRAHVQVCGTTPCMLRGSEALMDVCRRKINPEPFETSADGALSWEEVECQGACVNAPMVMIARDTYEDLTPERLEEIIDLFAAGNGAEVPAGPQIDRIYSAPVGGPTTLTSLENTPRAKASGSAAGGARVPPSKAAAGQPAAVERPDTPDDLKMISGIGPKIEERLHGIGIWTWQQIANWSDAESDWVGSHLNFRGRIEREDWVKQARALAKGGEAEYVRVFGKLPR